MSKLVYIGLATMLTGCMSIHARASNTGHLFVAFTDKETGKAITNATVFVLVDKSNSPSWHASPIYERTKSKTDTNGIAHVQFTFGINMFSWHVKTPSHYSQRFLHPGYEQFGGVVEQSDYLDVNTNTVEGLARYNELQALYESGDYLSYAAKFEPKSVTYTNNVIFRSVSFYPKRNPQPMYTYGSGTIDYLSMKNPTTVITNGLEITCYKPVDFDMRKGLVVSYDPNHDEHWDGPVGEVADFQIKRFRVTTNNVETVYGWIEFAPGCGAYKSKTTGDSSFPTTYEADTNATFLSRFSFECSSISGRVVRAQKILNRDEYMVLRTRVMTNEVGVVTNSNYSKILGPMYISHPMNPSDRVHFKSLIFNPTPNDPNLEYDLKNNLSTRGDGSWYP